MDASVYLRKQGWLGEGHSLDQTGKGIKRPLLVSKKIDVLGVGLNKHAAVSDQWWLRAYDQGLKDFGTGKQNLLGQVQKHGHSRGGLYGRFVKGEEVPGTIEPSLESTPTGSTTLVEKKVGGEMASSAGAIIGDGNDAPTKKRKREDKFSEQKEIRAKRRRESIASTENAPSKKRKNDSKDPNEKRAQRRLDREAKAQKQSESNNESRPSETSGVDIKSVINLEAVADLKSARDRALERKRQAQMAKKARKTMTPEQKRTFKKEQREERARQKAEIAKAEAANNKASKDAGIEGDLQAVPPQMARKRGRPKSKKQLREESKQEQVDSSRVSQHGTDIAIPRREVQAGKVRVLSVEEKKSKLSPEKFQEYLDRAREKEISIDEYIRRRVQKHAIKQGEKLCLSSNGTAIEELDPPVVTTANSLGFVVDTTGDESLATKPPKMKKQKDLPQLPEFAEALAKIGRNESVVINDDVGEEVFRWDPSIPIPNDKRLWQGVEIKTLPKVVRKARKAWMAVRREAKKQGLDPGKVEKREATLKKSKGTRKVEAREGLLWKILLKSRQYAKDGKLEGKKAGEIKVEVAKYKDVPLVQVGGGAEFTKGEMSLARTVATRILKREKTDGKGEKGEKKKNSKQIKDSAK
ncbi:hypothetical protein LTR97_003649 [Elasticomyces elasticus]|uniref:G-patch domain-containing protein n=1 Tax=Elasticomyces elasticus TaxID=574655 RepID=A0AAN7WCU9_9PEZI|nr:hypothetical protein LTR97_003649 [Elasticomyces elasticus]